MKFNAKKEAKKLIDSLNIEIAKIREELRIEWAKDYSDRRDLHYLHSQEDKLKELTKLVKGKDILHAFKVLSSENQKKVFAYIDEELPKLSKTTQK